MSRRTLLQLLLVLVLPASGSGSALADDDAPAAQPAVKLLDAGVEPRSPLRYRFMGGGVQTFSVIERRSTAVTVDGKPQPTRKSPPIKMTVKLTIMSIDENRNAHCEALCVGVEALADPTLPATTMELMKQSFATLAGVKGECVISNRGEVSGAKVEDKPDLDPYAAEQLENLRQAIARCAMLFPEEPVGAGARWELREKASDAGISAEHVQTVQLKGREEDELDLAYETVTSAPEQDVITPGEAGENVKQHLKSMAGKGRGTLNRYLGWIFPVSGESSATIDIVMQVSGGSAPQEIHQHIETSTTMQSLPAGAGQQHSRPDSAPAH